MPWEQIALIILTVVSCVLAALLITLLRRSNGTGQRASRALDEMRKDMADGDRALRSEIADTVQKSINSLGELALNGMKHSAEQQAERFTALDHNLSSKQDLFGKSVSITLARQEERFKTFALENEQKLENIRRTVERNLADIRKDNGQKLDEMRNIVDEKLQKTLDERMTQSFRLVNERLEQVYKGLGEMQALAVGVGDLKKVLSNVKTRGILGEIQLGAILGEILAPEQYVKNAAVKRNSRNVVEYAVKLPSGGGESVFLPIDSKFPADAYSDLRDAYDSGSPDAVSAAASALTGRLKQFARDIRDKYIDPPNTTEFAVMFLPTEGLYAEAVNRGLVEALQRDYHVSIAGPSTMAALLNSLQMGFRSFAIQKRSSEVWNVLGAVKTEFDRFADVLIATQNRLEQANQELDNLVGVRTRQIQRRLKTVAALPLEDAGGLLYGPEGVDYAAEEPC